MCETRKLVMAMLNWKQGLLCDKKYRPIADLCLMSVWADSEAGLPDLILFEDGFSSILKMHGIGRYHCFIILRKHQNIFLT